MVGVEGVVFLILNSALVIVVYGGVAIDAEVAPKLRCSWVVLDGTSLVWEFFAALCEFD
ncbi:hypothetical protein ACFL3V_06265 [Nanoarchaeota archaeon]